MKTKMMDLRETHTVPLQKVDKSDLVRSVFEDVPRYLGSRQVDIRIRADTVKHLAVGLKWQRLLDIGCGNGSISLPLLTPTSRFTLLDLSAGMLAAAQTNIPRELTSNVEIRNENFAMASFAEGAFDLIIAVGVLAHVDSPEEFILKITKILRPGGALIIAFTDSHHITGRLARFTGWLKEVFAPAKYSVNVLSFSQVDQLFKRNQMTLKTIYRYAELPIPKIGRILSNEMLYRGVRMIFGSCGKNRNAWLGNEYICLLTREC